MLLVCPQCHHHLEFAGSRPKFCSQCGQRLIDPPPGGLDSCDSAPTTIPPERLADAETLPPPVFADGANDVPEAVGSYRLLRRLGGGGMGTVYEAIDTSSGRRVAVKLLQPEYVSSKQAIERFRQEGELASKISHPRCVFVLAADQDQGQPYIVMELMTGATLDGLVREQGPLPPEQALRKILDVIDGLNEAHRLGLVHRDVKPSNCFLETDGRVKIGDFGLAKSLQRPAHLTAPRTFLGTPSFAAPEQIKMETVDIQSDVYSVAATLYFLLTGQAPFQTGDVMATMARRLVEDPPSLRTLRPELPKALDKAVLRGLQRDRKRRWRNLEEFRRALLPFLPAEPSVGGVGLRLVGFCLDTVLLGIELTVVWQGGQFPLYASPEANSGAVHKLVVPFVLFVAYYGLLEGIWGWSVGKRLLRLRVGTAITDRSPGVGRALLRAGLLYAILHFDALVSHLFLVPSQGKESATEALSSPAQVLVSLWPYISLGLMTCTMRKRNGYRGLHEFLSGTRTYRLRWPQLKKPPTLRTADFHPEVEQYPGLPEQIGPYRIRGTLFRTPQDETVLADDVQLGRAVWIWLRPQTEPPLTEARRTVSRTTRVRWVSCGTLDDRQWDAFLVPTGCPLPSLEDAGRRLSWTEFRGILENLMEEMRASCTEGTLPSTLTPHQVWIGPQGRVQFVEIPLERHASATTGHPQPANDHQRALAFLGAVTIRALEGKARPDGAPLSPLQVPLPLYAADVLNRLVVPSPASLPVGPDRTTGKRRFTAARPPSQHVEQFQADLLATQSEPPEITRGMRATQLLGHGLYACVGLLAFALLTLEWLMEPPSSVHLPPDGIDEIVPIVGVLAFGLFSFFLPAFVTRGGLSFLRTGIAVVRPDGRQASRFRCLGRAVVAWAFMALLAALISLGISTLSEMRWLGFGMLGLGAALFAGYVGLMLRTPARAPHDVVAGTYLVPK